VNQRRTLNPMFVTPAIRLGDWPFARGADIRGMQPVMHLTRDDNGVIGA